MYANAVDYLSRGKRAACLRDDVFESVGENARIRTATCVKKLWRIRFVNRVRNFKATRTCFVIRYAFVSRLGDSFPEPTQTYRVDATKRLTIIESRQWHSAGFSRCRGRRRPSKTSLIIFQRAVSTDGRPNLNYRRIVFDLHQKSRNEIGRVFLGGPTSNLRRTVCARRSKRNRRNPGSRGAIVFAHDRRILFRKRIPPRLVWYRLNSNET